MTFRGIQNIGVHKLDVNIYCLDKELITICRHMISLDMVKLYSSSNSNCIRIYYDTFVCNYCKQYVI